MGDPIQHIRMQPPPWQKGDLPDSRDHDLDPYARDLLKPGGDNHGVQHDPLQEQVDHTFDGWAKGDGLDAPNLSAPDTWFPHRGDVDAPDVGLDGLDGLDGVDLSF